MKRIIIIIMMVTIIMAIIIPVNSFAYVDGINEHNYLSYTKPHHDRYGYNKGETGYIPYRPYEEEFYSKFIDHYNVDKVYDYECGRRMYDERMSKILNNEKTVTIKCTKTNWIKIIPVVINKILK